MRKETHPHTFTADEVVERIQAEMIRRREARSDNGLAASDQVNASSLSALARLSRDWKRPFRLQPEFSWRKGEAYDVRELLNYHDVSFITNAFLAILGRLPDPVGMRHYLNLLRSGAATKTDILGRLRYSREGRSKRSAIRGLLWRFAVHRSYRLPLIGYAVQWMTAFGGLPSIVRHARRFEAYSLFLHETLAREVDRPLDLANAVEQELDGALSQVAAELKRLDLSFEQRDIRWDATRRDLALGIHDVEAKRATLEIELSGANAQLDDLRDAVRGVRSELSEQSHRTLRPLSQTVELQSGSIQLLEHQLARASSAREELRLRLESQSQQIEVGSESIQAVEDQLARERAARARRRDAAEEYRRELDDTLVAFHDRLRGSREDIRDRLRRYLPMVRAADNGAASALVLDVACGRGEWLELLQDEGLVGRGVDLNHHHIEGCKSLGLDVVEGDLLEYIRELPDASLRSVTGFHIIEHLSFEQFSNLIDQTYRALRPGGIAIFETPNPENVQVGSNTFYNDPTHRNLLPPLLAHSLLEARGLSRVEVVQLHPCPSSDRVPGGGALTRRFNEFFFGPRDYAVIGYKT